MKRRDFFSGLYYEVQGEGEAMIFLHGIGGSHNMFEPQVKELSSYYKTIAVDLKGNGKSTSVKTKSYTNVHIESILNLMNHLKLEKAIFVGLSYGGIITQLFAIKHPERVKKMVLIDTYAQTFPKGSSEIKLALLGASVVVASWFPKKILKKSLAYIAPYKRWELAQEQLLYISDNCRARDVTIQMLEVFNINLFEDLNKLDIPVLVIVGDQVQSIINKSKEIAEHLPNSQLYIVKDGIDPSNLCQPEVVNYKILEFVEETTFSSLNIQKQSHNHCISY